MAFRIGGQGEQITPARPTPPAAPTPRPVPPAAPAPAPWSGGGGGGGGMSIGPVSSRPVGGGGGGGLVAPTPPPLSTPPVLHIDPNAYKGDPGYIAQANALHAALQNYESDYTNKVGQYNTQYAQAIKNLGWNPGVAGAQGQWALKDTNTAAGRSYQAQNNDYAARGLLQSSLYAQAVDNLMRSLNDQNTNLQNNKQSYLSGLSTDKAQYEANNNYQLTQAANDAMNRIMSGLIGVGLPAGGK